MSDPSVAIQNAVEATLRADTAVKAEFGGTTRLYTMVAPVGAPLPHIIIGDDQIIGDDTECGSADDIVVTVHVFARSDTPAATRLKAKAISGAVRTALNVELSASGLRVIDWNFEGARHPAEPDGLTAHSVLTFAYHTAPSA